MVQTFDKHFYLSISFRDGKILADFSSRPIAQCFVILTTIFTASADLQPIDVIWLLL